MTNRERALAVLRYQEYDRLPIVHFGFWGDTLKNWADEGHLSAELAEKWGDGSPVDDEVTAALGFDMNWQCLLYPTNRLYPGFESKVVKTLPDGSQHVLTGEGVVMVQKPGAGSIPSHVDHLLKDRASWEEHYKHRYVWSEERVTNATVKTDKGMVPFGEGGLEFLKTGKRDFLYGLHCGSLFGQIRNVLGVEGSAYLQVDDEALFTEIIDTVADLCFQSVKYALESGAVFDFAHFWEDICFKNGPLISPSVFEEKVGPHYKRITELVGSYGLDIVSLDCDGKIDALVPTWVTNGVNTMFPIEVGTWQADIRPWRQQFGRELRGVGGMNKTVFSKTKAAVDAEIERLKELVAMGGYLPCPDHRIAPDAKWELVTYYTERMRESFG